MLLLELKEKLIKPIGEIDDETLLLEIYNMIRKDGEPYMLSGPQKEAIQRGLEDYKNGRVTSDEEAQKEIDEWLKNYDFEND